MTLVDHQQEEMIPTDPFNGGGKKEDCVFFPQQESLLSTTRPSSLQGVNRHFSPFEPMALIPPSQGTGFSSHPVQSDMFEELLLRESLELSDNTDETSELKDLSLCDPMVDTEDDFMKCQTQIDHTTVTVMKPTPSLPVLVKGTTGQNMTALPHGFNPGEYDVICGRGRKAFSHVGNERFRNLVKSRLEEYSSAAAKLEKSDILSVVVCEVRQRSPNGGFVKRDPTSGYWYEVGDFLAREKTSQAFRDSLHDQYKSSNTAKKKRRMAEQAEKVVFDQNSASSLNYHHSSQHNSSRFSFQGSLSQSLHFQTPGDFGMSKPPMVPVSRYEPSQDSLLGALDVEISASLNKRSDFAVNGYNSARSVVDCGPTPMQRPSMQQQYGHPSWMNKSCPNLGGGGRNPRECEESRQYPLNGFEVSSPQRTMGKVTELAMDESWH